MRNLEAEDLALLGSIAALLAASIVDAAVESSFFKAAKIIALVVSLYLAWDRIRTARPFWKDVAAKDWTQLANREFEIRVPRSQHGRGKTPYPRAMESGADGYSRVGLDELVLPDGTVVFRVGQPTALRLEVRK